MQLPIDVVVVVVVVVVGHTVGSISSTSVSSRTLGRVGFLC